MEIFLIASCCVMFCFCVMIILCYDINIILKLIVIIVIAIYYYFAFVFVIKCFIKPEFIKYNDKVYYNIFKYENNKVYIYENGICKSIEIDKVHKIKEGDNHLIVTYIKYKNNIYNFLLRCERENELYLNDKGGI